MKSLPLLAAIEMRRREREACDEEWPLVLAGTLVSWSDRGVPRSGVLVEYGSDIVCDYMLVRSLGQDIHIPDGYPFKVEFSGVRL